MTVSIGRGFKWFVLLLLIAGAFVYYTRQNPNWKTSVHQVMHDLYLIPDRPRARSQPGVRSSSGGGAEKVEQTRRDMEKMHEASRAATLRG